MSHKKSSSSMVTFVDVWKIHLLMFPNLSMESYIISALLSPFQDNYMPGRCQLFHGPGPNFELSLIEHFVNMPSHSADHNHCISQILCGMAWCFIYKCIVIQIDKQVDKDEFFFLACFFFSSKNKIN